MARIVIITGRVKSKLITTAEIGRRLQAAGHQVSYLGPQAGEELPDGCPFIAFDLFSRGAAVPRPRRKTLPGKLWGFLQDLATMSKRREAAVDQLDLEGLGKALDELSPDLTLIDTEAHEYLIAVSAMGRKVALISLFFNMWKRAGAPPLHSAIVPGKGWTGSRAGITWRWSVYRISKWLGQKRDFLLRRGQDHRSRLEALAARVGYPLGREVDRHQWLMPFNYRSLPVLTMHLPELELPHRVHERAYYVGPMVNTHRPEKGVEDSGSELARLLAEHAAGRRRKLVLCSFGSFFGGDDREFWRRLAAAVADCDWDVVFALGNRMQAAEFDALPANVLCLDWAPQMRILELADCAVIHGGMTSVYECIHHRVPMVVYPFAVNDQLGTAARVDYHRIGVVGDRSGDDAALIRQHVQSALTDPAIRSNLDRFRHCIETCSADRRLEQVVDSLLRGRTPGATVLAH